MKLIELIQESDTDLDWTLLDLVRICERTCKKFPDIWFIGHHDDWNDLIVRYLGDKSLGDDIVQQLSAFTNSRRASPVPFGTTKGQAYQINVKLNKMLSKEESKKFDIMIRDTINPYNL